jgi:hypothetical protein
VTEWTWHAYDAATNAHLGSLLLERWEQAAELKDAGSWSATLVPGASVILAADILNTTQEGRTFIVPVRNGQLVDGFAGWIPPGGRRRPELAGAGLLSWLDRQVLRAANIGGTTLTYSAVDQFAVAADLVDRAQAIHTIGIDTTQVGTSGVLRDQTWYSWESKNIGEALRQKSALSNGYDFDVRVELDAGDPDPTRRLRCWYPRRGRSFEAGTCPIFAAGTGGNVYEVPAVNAHEKFATVAHAIGAETGAVVTVGDSEVRVRLTYEAVAQDRIDAGYPSIVAELELPDIKSLAVLEDHAEGYLTRYGQQFATEIILDVNPDDITWPFGSWELGDDCLVVIPAGLTPWWPTGLSEIRRVVAHSWNVDADSGERLRVTTAPREAT